MRKVGLLAVAVLASVSVAWAQDKAPTAKVGQPAPEFTLTDIDGKTHKLSDYKDKVVVLEWFNCECPAVKGALPTLKKTHEQFRNKGVVWLAIDSTHFRKNDENVTFRKDNGLLQPILMDTDGTVGRTFGAKTTPHMFVINKGTLVYAGALDDAKGREPGQRNYVAEAIDASLNGKDVAVNETKPYGCSVKYQKD